MGNLDRTVILMLDSVRRDALPPYGGYAFPNIGKMSSDGVVYMNAKTPMGATLPAAESIAKHWEEVMPKSVMITDNRMLDESELNQKFEHYLPAATVIPPVDIAPMINWWMDYQDAQLVFFWTYVTHAPFYSWGQEFEHDTTTSTLWDQDSGPIAYPIPHLQQRSEYIRARYYGAIHSIDKHVIPALKAGKIILLSDHGECFGEHGLWGHANRKYRELVDIPLIVSGVGHGTVDKPWYLGSLYELTREVMERPLATQQQIVEGRLRDLGYIG